MITYVALIVFISLVVGVLLLTLGGIVYKVIAYIWERFDNWLWFKWRHRA